MPLTDPVVPAPSGHLGDHTALHRIFNVQAETPRINVRDRAYGALGNGTTDDSAAITAAVAAVASRLASEPCTLYFPAGRYRIANTSLPNGAVFFNGVSNLTILFDPGAVLYMDNLSGGAGTGHGIQVKGAGSNIRIINPTVEWKVAPTRSNGDGIRLLGYPADGAPASGWTGSTGTLRNVTVVNSHVINSPQTGMIALGCSDVTVVNHHADNTKADGLHLNACRRPLVLGVRGTNTGDDTLALVTYYHATSVWETPTAGPFNQPTLGDWNNTGGSATGIVSVGSAADGVRLAGARNMTVTNGSVRSPNAAGVVANSGTIGGVYQYQYLASRGCVVSDFVIDSPAGYGLDLSVFNTTFASSETFWRYNLAFRNIKVIGATQPAVRTAGNGSLNSGCTGVQFAGIEVDGTSDANFSALRDSSIESVTIRGGGNIIISGTDVVDTSALSGRARNGLVIGELHAIGGQVILQDLRGAEVDSIRSSLANASAVQLLRVIDVNVDRVSIDRANRGAAANISALVVGPAQQTQIGRYVVGHDASGSGFQAANIGGGDANNRTDGLRLERMVYRSTLNASTSGVGIQTGSFSPLNFFYDLRFYHGGEASPVWRREAFGAPSVPEHWYVNAAPGTTVAPDGSEWTNTQTGVLSVRQSGAWVAK